MVIHFERFGGDPKKRSIKNQILAQICVWFLIVSIFAKPLYVWSILIGPIWPKLAQICVFLLNCNGVIILLGLTEILLLQSLMLFRFSLSMGLDEGFFSKFVLLWNVGFAGLSNVDQMLDQFSMTSFLADLPSESNFLFLFLCTFGHNLIYLDSNFHLF